MVSFWVPTDTAVSEIRNRVAKIIGEQLGIADDKIVDTADFSEDLNADSLEVVQIVMEIKRNLASKFPMLPQTVFPLSVMPFASFSWQPLS